MEKTVQDVKETENKETAEKEEKPLTLRQRLAKGAHLGKKMLVMTRIGLAAAITGTVGGAGYYVHRQFHKSPEQIRAETAVMEDKVDAEMQKMFGAGDSNKEAEKTANETAETGNDAAENNKAKEAIGKAAGRIARTGASHGGAVREWIAKKVQGSR